MSTFSVWGSRFKVIGRVHSYAVPRVNTAEERKKERKRKKEANERKRREEVKERGERRRMIDGENRLKQSLWLRTGEDISSRRRCQDSIFGASRSRTPGARGNHRVQGHSHRHAISVILPPVTYPPPGDLRGILFLRLSLPRQGRAHSIVDARCELGNLYIDTVNRFARIIVNGSLLCEIGFDRAPSVFIGN